MLVQVRKHAASEHAMSCERCKHAFLSCLLQDLHDSVLALTDSSGISLKYVSVVFVCGV